MHIKHNNSYDIVIVGATEAGLILAKNLLELELSTCVISHRPYLAEDRCGDFLFWDSSGKFTATPMQIKTAWEHCLLENGGSYLLNTHTVGWLETAVGSVGGVICANRSGLSMIPARIVIDASTEGLMARLIGNPTSFLQKGKCHFRHRVLGQLPTTEPSQKSGLEPACGQVDNQPYVLYPREHRIEKVLKQNSLAEWFKAEAQISAESWQPGDFQHQERLCPIWEISSENDSNDPDWPALKLREGIYSISPGSERSAPWRHLWMNPIAATTWLNQAAKKLPQQFRDIADNAQLKSCFPKGSYAIEFPLFNRLSIEDSHGHSTLSGEPISSLPLLGEYDVIVAGGGTGGASAAIGAARSGASTLVIEQLDALGGIGTLGQIATYWYGNRTGFTSEIDKGVAALEWQDDFKKGDGKWSVAAKSAWYLKQCLKEGVDIWFRSQIAAVMVKDKTFQGILVATPYGCGLVKAHCVVDSSGAAEIPAMIGAATTCPGREHLAVQGTGLAGIQPGREYHNSDHNFSDESSVQDAISILHSARKKFSDHFDCGQLIDSRERRQIIGEFTLEPVDFLYHRTFPDTICCASSNFDSHGFTIHPLFMIKPPSKEQLWADVPFRCLLPKGGWERILVTGLGISAHRDALPVIRMQADVQNHGYAAGNSAAMAANRKCNLRELPIHELQQHLIEIGNLPARVLSDTDNFPVADETLLQAIEKIEEHTGLALVFAEPIRSIPLLLKEMQSYFNNPDKQLYLARIIGQLGNPAAQLPLIQFLSNTPWDNGWNFQGMHQFGLSLSPVDTALIAAATCGDPAVWECIRTKTETLPESMALSHIRAICIASEKLHSRHPHPQAGEWLTELLQIPGITGHSRSTLSEIWHSTNNDPNDNNTRNQSLSEIYLARAVFHCGDPLGLAETILINYSKDLRGHFARHAKTILSRALSPELFQG